MHGSRPTTRDYGRGWLSHESSKEVITSSPARTNTDEVEVMMKTARGGQHDNGRRLLDDVASIHPTAHSCALNAVVYKDLVPHHGMVAGPREDTMDTFPHTLLALATIGNNDCASTAAATDSDFGNDDGFFCDTFSDDRSRRSIDKAPGRQSTVGGRREATERHIEMPTPKAKTPFDVEGEHMKLDARFAVDVGYENVSDELIRQAKRFHVFDGRRACLPGVRPVDSMGKFYEGPHVYILTNADGVKQRAHRSCTQIIENACGFSIICVHAVATARLNRKMREGGVGKEDQAKLLAKLKKCTDGKRDAGSALHYVCANYMLSTDEERRRIKTPAEGEPAYSCDPAAPALYAALDELLARLKRDGGCVWRIEQPKFDPVLRVAGSIDIEVALDRTHKRLMLVDLKRSQEHLAATRRLKPGALFAAVEGACGSLHYKDSLQLALNEWLSSLRWLDTDQAIVERRSLSVHPALLEKHNGYVLSEPMPDRRAEVEYLLDLYSMQYRGRPLRSVLDGGRFLPVSESIGTMRLEHGGGDGAVYASFGAYVMSNIGQACTVVDGIVAAAASHSSPPSPSTMLVVPSASPMSRCHPAIEAARIAFAEREEWWCVGVSKERVVAELCRAGLAAHLGAHLEATAAAIVVQMRRQRAAFVGDGETNLTRHAAAYYLARVPSLLVKEVISAGTIGGAAYTRALAASPAGTGFAAFVSTPVPSSSSSSASAASLAAPLSASGGPTRMPPYTPVAVLNREGGAVITSADFAGVPEGDVLYRARLLFATPHDVERAETLLRRKGLDERFLGNIEGFKPGETVGPLNRYRLYVRGAATGSRIERSVAFLNNANDNRHPAIPPISFTVQFVIVSVLPVGLCLSRDVRDALRWALEVGHVLESGGLRNVPQSGMHGPARSNCRAARHWTSEHCVARVWGEYVEQDAAGAARITPFYNVAFSIRKNAPLRDTLSSSPRSFTGGGQFTVPGQRNNNNLQYSFIHKGGTLPAVGVHFIGRKYVVRYSKVEAVDTVGARELVAEWNRRVEWEAEEHRREERKRRVEKEEAEKREKKAKAATIVQRMRDLANRQPPGRLFTRGWMYDRFRSSPYTQCEAGLDALLDEGLVDMPLNSMFLRFVGGGVMKRAREEEEDRCAMTKEKRSTIEEEEAKRGEREGGKEESVLGTGGMEERTAFVEPMREELKYLPRLRIDIDRLRVKFGMTTDQRDAAVDQLVEDGKLEEPDALGRYYTVKWVPNSQPAVSTALAGRAESGDAERRKKAAERRQKERPGVLQHEAERRRRKRQGGAADMMSAKKRRMAEAKQRCEAEHEAVIRLATKMRHEAAVVEAPGIHTFVEPMRKLMANTVPRGRVVVRSNLCNWFKKMTTEQCTAAIGALVAEGVVEKAMEDSAFHGPFRNLGITK